MEWQRAINKQLGPLQFNSNIKLKLGGGWYDSAQMSLKTIRPWKTIHCELLKLKG